MKGIKVYRPPGKNPQVGEFLDGQEARFREKLILMLYRLPQIPRSALKEPHYKHFSIERYRSLYELREKGHALVRIIFTHQPDGNILLLYAFVKRQKRDTMQALEQSLKILAELRKHPEYAVEFKIKEEVQ